MRVVRRSGLAVLDPPTPLAAADRHGTCAYGGLRLCSHTLIRMDDLGAFGPHPPERDGEKSGTPSAQFHDLPRP